MGTLSRNRARCAQTALATVLTFTLPLSVSAQITGNSAPIDSAAASARNDSDPAPSKVPDVSIITHEAVGKVGVPLPLEIKLVRAREVDIEALTLLGLPPGMSISDGTHTFSPYGDNKDVDISSWDLPKLQITQSDERSGGFLLALAAIWMPVNGGRYEVSSSRFNVKFVRDIANLSVSGGEPGNRERSAQISETATSTHPVLNVADRLTPVSDVMVPEVHVTPIGKPAAIDRRATLAADDEKVVTTTQAVASPRTAVSPQATPQIDPLVERARGLIKLGDISGARLLLERAQTRNAPNATFLLAQTWDPTMLKTWKVRGLRADPDLARSLYAKAAGQERSDERLLAATNR